MVQLTFGFDDPSTDADTDTGSGARMLYDAFGETDDLQARYDLAPRVVVMPCPIL